MKKFLLYVAIILLLTAGMAAAADESWLQLGGDYQFRYDNLNGTVHEYREFYTNVAIPSYKVQNAALFTNRWGLNMKANPLEDVSFKVRLLAYKLWGNQTNSAIKGLYMGMPGLESPVFDGVMGHYPGGSEIYVDQAYAGWSNILEQPVWFSIGRKPSTGGAPTNIRQNLEKTGTAGVPGFLIDASFDGYTIGYAPDIESLPGFFVKWCQGKGMDNGYTNATEIPRDTDFGGLMITYYDTPELHVESLIMEAANMMSAPPDGMVVLDHYWPSNANVGNIQWWGLGAMGKVMDNLNLFATIAQNFFDPSEQVRADFGMGMLWQQTYPLVRERHSGTGIYVGGRYDIESTGTKIGLEYNHGTKYWMPYGATSNDIWGNKLNTRGSAYEVYLIQELNEKPVAKRGKAFFRIGWQYYDFEYTGSLNWLEVPVKIADLKTTDTLGAGEQWFIPLRRATDLYVTFDVLF
jgi:hypothetical protein